MPAEICTERKKDYEFHCNMSEIHFSLISSEWISEIHTHFHSV